MLRRPADNVHLSRLVPLRKPARPFNVFLLEKNSVELLQQYSYHFYFNIEILAINRRRRVYDNLKKETDK